MAIAQDKIITTWPDANALAHAVAHFIVLESKKAIANKNYFTIALSGGSTPAILYKHLATEPYRSNIDWKKVIVAFGDERFVSHQSDESNFKMAKDTMLSKLPIPKKNILGIATENITPAESAKDYQRTLKQFVNRKNPFDLVLLGIGEDGHTASIFPGNKPETNSKEWVKAVWVKEKNMDRISFTLPFINKTKNIAFLVSGKNKAAILKKIFSSKGKNLPAAQVKALHHLYCFLDDAAASLL